MEPNDSDQQHDERPVRSDDYADGYLRGYDVATARAASRITDAASAINRDAPSE